MNFNKFYELAKQNGLEVAELTQSKSSTFSIEIFKKEITREPRIEKALLLKT